MALDISRSVIQSNKPGGRTRRIVYNIINKNKTVGTPIKIMSYVGKTLVSRPTTRVIDPDPTTNPASEGFPGSGFGPGLNPAVTITVIGPGGVGSGDTPAATVAPNPDTSPGTGYNRRTACIRGLVIVVDSEGNITHSATSGTTTNSLNLITLLTNAGLKPSTAGKYQFTFEFFGWRRQGNNLHSNAWISDDSRYNIYTVISEPVYSIN